MSTISSGGGPAAEIDLAQEPQSAEEVEAIQKQLQAVIDEVVGIYGGLAAIAVSNGNDVATAGADYPLAAWSTIKVPMAIAAERLNAGLDQAVHSAITVSDNDAGAQLWAALGTPEQAGEIVGGIIAEAGQPVQVNTIPPASGFSSYGQTRWSTSQQAQFASQLRCISGADPVIDLMGHIDSSQVYGIGIIPGTYFKSGWGPNDYGMYDLRQLGLVPAPEGEVGVALTTSAQDGSYESAQLMANEIAQRASLIIMNSSPTHC